MILCSKNNNYIKYSFDIIFQISLITIFLTVFFFSYVSKVEQGEFSSQIKFIVDQILTDDDIKMLIPPNLNQKQKEDLSIFVSGALEAAKRKSAISLKSSIDSVNDNNNKIRSFSYKLPNLAKQFKQAIIVVIFVGLTELVFLELIAKNYISANPNKIKSTIATAILDWVKDNPGGFGSEQSNT
jgi:hypothetical protein